MKARHWLYVCTIWGCFTSLTSCSDDQQQQQEAVEGEEGQEGDNSGANSGAETTDEYGADAGGISGAAAAVANATQDAIKAESETINNTSVTDIAPPPIIEQPAIDPGPALPPPGPAPVVSPTSGGRVMYVRSNSSLHSSPGGAVVGSLGTGDHPLIWLPGSNATPTAQPSDPLLTQSPAAIPAPSNAVGGIVPTSLNSTNGSANPFGNSLAPMSFDGF